MQLKRRDKVIRNVSIFEIWKVLSAEFGGKGERGVRDLGVRLAN
jgi:hypothetical protein